MRLKNVCILPFWILIIINGFSGFGQEIPKKIRIDPNSAFGGKASTFLEEVSFIPLETTRESQFSDVIQLSVGTKYIALLDKDNTAILIFTKAGKFHKKISTRYPIFRFSFDGVRDQLSFDVFPNSFWYDMDGNLLRKVSSTEMPTGQYGVSKQRLNDSVVAYFNTIKPIGFDSVVNELLFYNKGRLVKAALPFPKGYKMDALDEFGFKNFIINPAGGSDTDFYYIRNFDYTVYKLSPGGVTPAYQLIFPLQYAIPDDFRQTQTNRLQYVQKESEKITRLFTFNKDKELLYFDDGHRSLLYSLRSRRLIDLDKIHSDSLSFFLPVSGNEVHANRFTLQTFDGRSFYTFCPADALFSGMEATDKSKRSYPAPLREFFQNKKNASGNPILILLRFKPGI